MARGLAIYVFTMEIFHDGDLVRFQNGRSYYCCPSPRLMFRVRPGSRTRCRRTMEMFCLGLSTDPLIHKMFEIADFHNQMPGNTRRTDPLVGFIAVHVWSASAAYAQGRFSMMVMGGYSAGRGFLFFLVMG